MYIVITRELAVCSTDEINGFLRHQAKHGQMIVVDVEKKMFLGKSGEWEELENWKDSKHNKEKCFYKGIAF